MTPEKVPQLSTVLPNSKIQLVGRHCKSDIPAASRCTLANSFSRHIAMSERIAEMMPCYCLPTIRQSGNSRRTLRVEVSDLLPQICFPSNWAPGTAHPTGRSKNFPGDGQAPKFTGDLMVMSSGHTGQPAA